MPVIIRLAEAGDYPELSQLYNLKSPFKVSADQLLRSDQLSAERDGQFRRAVAFSEGRLVATGDIWARWADKPQPGRYCYWVSAQATLPGSCATLVTWLAELVPGRAELAACVRSDFVPAAHYLRDLNFVKRFVSWGAQLELASFDFNRYAPLLAQLEDQGLRLVAWPELSSDTREQELHELQRHIDQDVLSFDPVVPSAQADVLGPDCIREGLIVAVSPHGELVGLTSLRRDAPGAPLETGLTGVHRDWRGRGIATALKVRALKVARELGAEEIGTGGGGSDSPMQRLNRKLGFTIGPEWVTFTRPL